jgi:hypothetical protein
MKGKFSRLYLDLYFSIANFNGIGTTPPPNRNSSPSASGSDPDRFLDKPGLTHRLIQVILMCIFAVQPPAGMRAGSVE